MRHLAAKAQVALKTPYNLYGSKTGVLLALLDRVMVALVSDMAPDKNQLILVDLLRTLGRVRAFYEGDEIFYKSVLWGVMTSNDPDDRVSGHNRIMDIVVGFTRRANEAGELDHSVYPEDLGQLLGLTLLSTMGSWAGGNITIARVFDHTRAVWIALLIQAAAPNLKDQLSQLL